MYYILYRTENILTNEFYLGVHRTLCLEDGYLGSGIRLRCAIKKYGKENFRKIILEHFSSEDEMYTRENEIITRDFIAQPNVYNLVRGGRGVREHQSWTLTNPEAQRQHAKKAALISVQKRKSKSYEYQANIRTQISKSLKRINKERRERGENHPVKGRIREKIKCPHCDVYGSKNTMLRWHFDNCKFIKNNDKLS